MRRRTDAQSAIGGTGSVNAPAVSQILGQESFLRMLYLERKRTERSGRRFVLMLLESQSLLKANSDGDALPAVLSALSQATRETDIKGWHKEGQVIGIIFTEIDGEHGKAVAVALLTRVSAALASTLGIEDINEIRLSFHVFPEDSGSHGHDTPKDPLLYPDLDTDQKKAARILKRVMDIAGSLFGLVAGSPLLLVIAAVIKLTSRGPVLFRQQRVGQRGKRFTFLKFRSMYKWCDHTVHQEYVKSLIAGEAPVEAPNGEGVPVFKLTNDSRVTPFGRFLRKSSLDELPQLFNVLAGDMSLVGPRPAIPYEVESYGLWHRQRLLAAKPGMTGLWQVDGRSRTKFSDMVRLDLRYAKSWSLLLDIKILLKTPRAVISGEGAY
jgi:lipopolysaccharide/colanic/teichoic acid biosynthesis glycosyltransferase